jgi:hypothetical protein
LAFKKKDNKLNKLIQKELDRIETEAKKKFLFFKFNQYFFREKLIFYLQALFKLFYPSANLEN